MLRCVLPLANFPREIETAFRASALCYRGTKAIPSYKQITQVRRRCAKSLRIYESCQKEEDNSFSFSFFQNDKSMAELECSL
jgi:hypothetical protein